MPLPLRLALCSLIALLLLPARGLAEEPDAPRAELREELQKLFDVQSARDAKLAEVRSAVHEAGAAKLAACLAQGRVHKADVPTGWLERTNACTDGVARNYLLFVPEDYTPAKKYRLLIDMHGGVSRAQMLSHAELEQMKFFWGEHAEKNGYLLAIPAGQKDAEWWHPVGAQNVLGLIRRVKREYNVDENQVLATGFSDGGSGSFYLALAHTTPFAGFIPLNGHVGVAGARGLQVHLRALANKPIYAVNTENDSLYPSKGIQPVIEAIQKLGAPLLWRDIPGFRHEPTYLPEERPAIAAWMDKVRRKAHPREIVWEGAADRPGRVHWLQVRRVAEAGNNETLEDVNPAVGPGRVLIGIGVDREFTGGGVKVTSVSKDSPAEAVGLAVGDVIVRFDEVDIAGLQDLRKALSAKEFGDSFALQILRGEDKKGVAGSFPEAKPSPALRRGKPWGSLRATVSDNTIDVHVQRIAAFDLYLSPELVDLAKAVVVRVNGDVVHDAVVPADVGFMLEQALEDEDRTMVYWARLPVTVSEKAPSRR